MKALIQRVMHARVAVNNEVISSIDQGLCIFIGISVHDSAKDMEKIVRKILNAKLFDDDRNKRWKKNVTEKKLEILCISQFTLYSTWKGTKPDFHNAMSGEQAKDFYNKFLQLLKSQYEPEKIKDGKFGAYMQVTLTNDGPVTFEIETKAHSQTDVSLPEGSTTNEELAVLNSSNAKISSKESKTGRQGRAADRATDKQSDNTDLVAEEVLLRTHSELNAGMEALSVDTDNKDTPQKNSFDIGKLDKNDIGEAQALQGGSFKESKQNSKDDAKEKQGPQGDSSERAIKNAKPRNKSDAKDRKTSQSETKERHEETRV